jgi:beta-lactamase regulating signal transducer with metallopeptidase domain
MTSIEQYISEDFIYAFGWTVIHSVWQILLIALLLGGLFLSKKNRLPQRKFNLAFSAMLLSLFSGILTFSYFFFDVKLSTSNLLQTDGITESANENVALISQLILPKANSVFMEYLPLIVTFWLLGVLLFGLKHTIGLLYIRHLKKAAKQRLPIEYDRMVLKLSRALGITKMVDVAASSLVKVPMVIGHFKPIILFPLGAVNQLTTSEVEAIIAHELAHISRNDYLKNILIAIIESLFYYHPAIWWFSSIIKKEREYCCDDLTIQQGVQPLVYAKTLMKIETWNQRTPDFSMPFTGNKRLLLTRVQRILNHPHKKSNIMEKMIAVLMLSFAILMLSANNFINAATKNNSTEPMLTEENGRTVYSIEKEKNGTKISINHPLEKSQNTDPTYSTKPTKAPKAVKPAKRAKASKSVKPVKGVKPIKAAKPLSKKDSLPLLRGTSNYVFTRNNDKVEMKSKDGEITFLKINGEVIPASDYEEYEDYVADLLETLPPAPPVPMAPPIPPAPPTPPMPAVPAVGAIPPVPPTPPAPPAPPAPSSMTHYDAHSLMSARQKRRIVELKKELTRANAMELERQLKSQLEQTRKIMQQQRMEMRRIRELQAKEIEKLIEKMERVKQN